MERVVTGVDEIPWGNVRHITPQCGLENPNAPMFASASVWHDLGHRTAVHIEGRVLRGLDVDVYSKTR